jgi:hypothetical protein
LTKLPQQPVFSSTSVFLFQLLSFSALTGFLSIVGKKRERRLFVLHTLEKRKEKACFLRVTSSKVTICQQQQTCSFAMKNGDRQCDVADVIYG